MDYCETELFVISIRPQSGANSDAMMLFRNIRWLDFVAPHDALRRRAGLRHLSF